MTTVESVMLELPAMPELVQDVVQDAEGYDMELSAERRLSALEAESFGAAVLSMSPVVRVDESKRARGLVSVDDETLWVYVHSVGPGRFGPEEEAESRELLAELWREIHEAVARS
ncbi:MAG: hypothetical protein WCP95_04785 [Actinomycetes bacterium]